MLAGGSLRLLAGRGGTPPPGRAARLGQPDSATTSEPVTRARDPPTSQYRSEQEPGVWDLQPEGLGHSPFTKWDVWGISLFWAIVSSSVKR